MHRASCWVGFEHIFPNAIRLAWNTVLDLCCPWHSFFPSRFIFRQHECIHIAKNEFAVVCTRWRLCVTSIPLNGQSGERNHIRAICAGVKLTVICVRWARLLNWHNIKTCKSTEYQSLEPEHTHRKRITSCKMVHNEMKKEAECSRNGKTDCTVLD